MWKRESQERPGRRDGEMEREREREEIGEILKVGAVALLLKQKTLVSLFLSSC
jgi:hypothetical protein